MTGKKKRSLSYDDDKTEEKASSAATQNKSSKKQKVNQEKDGRKAQKVIITTHYHIKALEFFLKFMFKLLVGISSCISPGNQVCSVLRLFIPFIIIFHFHLFAQFSFKTQTHC